jgi:DNA anti-recombination protein RmuC
MKAAMPFLTLMFAASLTGCDPQLTSKVTAQAEELASLHQRVARLEQNMAALEQTVKKQQQSVGNWTLYQVSEALNSGYPQALSAYSSKPECVAASATWSYPGGKVVGVDPTIWQLKGYRVRLECLPVGTTPYAH